MLPMKSKVSLQHKRRARGTHFERGEIFSPDGASGCQIYKKNYGVA